MSKFTRLYLRVPRPKSLFGLISLQTGTELISLALIFNKVTGVYGLLAILTGYDLSLLQLSTYIYSLAVLIGLVFLIPHIRRQTPFQCISLAWLYAIDCLVNIGYTVAFGLSWYIASTGTPSGTTNLPSTDANAAAGSSHATITSITPRGLAAPEETAMSLVFISAANIIRIYFTLVVMAFARQVVQRYMHLMVLDAHVVNDHDGPFALDLPDGQGRKGRLGRIMVSVGRKYWLAVSEESDWTGNGHSRKTSSSGTLAGEV